MTFWSSNPRHAFATMAESVSVAQRTLIQASFLWLCFTFCSLAKTRHAIRGSSARRLAAIYCFHRRSIALMQSQRRASACLWQA